MDKLSYVLAELKRRNEQRGQLLVIAESIGLSRRTLKNLLDEKYKPNVATLDRLYDYLKANSRKRVL